MQQKREVCITDNAISKGNQCFIAKKKTSVFCGWLGVVCWELWLQSLWGTIFGENWRGPRLSSGKRRQQNQQSVQAHKWSTRLAILPIPRNCPCLEAANLVSGLRPTWGGSLPPWSAFCSAACNGRNDAKELRIWWKWKIWLWGRHTAEEPRAEGIAVCPVVSGSHKGLANTKLPGKKEKENRITSSDPIYQGGVDFTG